MTDMVQSQVRNFTAPANVNNIAGFVSRKKQPVST